MNERIMALRRMEPKQAGRASFLAILEAAAGLFRKVPSRDITLRDILAMSGVSNQTLYNYFPQGRDDIAIALYDRFQRTIVSDFEQNIRFIERDGPAQEARMVADLAACLARSVFGFLEETRDLQASVARYLVDHGLLQEATHTEELEAALAAALDTRFGHCFVHREVPRVARLCVRLAWQIAALALADPDLCLRELESNARKVLRTVLGTGLVDRREGGSGHDFPSYTPAPVAIVGAPLSSSKLEAILGRVLKRKRK